MKVSVIIPVYKAEKYLAVCVDSVLQQTYKELEVILVEDGSPDQCGQICDEYAKKDSRVKVIHKENQGVSMARNTGLELATGEYVQFVDSDDYLDIHMIETLVNALEESKADLVLCGFYEKNLNFDRVSKAEEDVGVYEKAQFLKGIMKNPYSFHYGVLWNKLFKREKIGNLRFLADMDFGEDLIFNLHYFGCCHTIRVIDEPLYYYIRYNMDSLMYIQAEGKREFSSYLRYLEKRLLLFERYQNFYKEQGLYKAYANQVNEYLLKVYVSEKIEIKRRHMTKQEKKQCLALLNENKQVKALKQEMAPAYYRKRVLKFRLAKYKVILRDTFVKN